MIRIIPAIDLIGGKCVRLTQGDYKRTTVYSENPVEQARIFEDRGIKYLHLVDLDGAKREEAAQLSVLEAIASATNLHIDYSGGIRSGEAINRAFSAGASQVGLGSIAVREPVTVAGWLKKYGADNVIISADCKAGRIATHAWQNVTDISVLKFINDYRQLGATQFVCTDIARDGMLNGPSIDLYRKILAQSDVRLIASGGVSTIKDVHRLNALGCDGVIIGKAIYERKISYRQLAKLT